MRLKKFPTYIQHDQMDCGPGCLKIIAKYYKNTSFKIFKKISKRNVMNIQQCQQRLQGNISTFFYAPILHPVHIVIPRKCFVARITLCNSKFFNFFSHFNDARIKNLNLFFLFILKELFDKNRVYARDFYPQRASKGCMAQRMNAFVIGTEGELYKCWHHLGIDKKVVGSIFAPHTISNYSMLSDMMIKNDAIWDDKCKSCVLFPSCYGGCIDEKSRNRDCCMPAKSMLEDFLDIHYIAKTSKKTLSNN